MSASTTYRTHETTSAALIRNSIILSATIALVGIAFAIFAGVIGLWLVGADVALWASILILAGFTLGLAFLFKNTWDNVRWMLVESIAAEIAERKANAKRIDAEAELTLANADAIDRASQGGSALQINNASNGGKITKPHLQAPTVRIQGKEVFWNQINQIDQSTPEPRRIEIPTEDVKFFCDELARGVKHSKANWLGRELPNSRIAVSWEVYRAFVDPLAERGQIVGRGPKASGRLVETDPSHLLAALNEHYPTGIVIEVPNQNEKPD